MYVGNGFRFEKRLKYVKNDVDMFETAKKCGKWRKYSRNGVINYEMTYRFGKWLPYLRNSLDIWGTA